MASGWWDGNGTIAGCVAAYQPIGAADLATSYVNLQNPGTYNAAPGVAPTFATATGWTFNGSTQYLTTGYTPPNQVGYSVIVRFSGVPTSGNNAIIGGSNTGESLNQGIIPRLALTGGTAFLANGNYVVPASAVSGVMAVAGNQGYLNGATHGSSWSAAGSTWKPQSIGRWEGPTPLYYLSGTIQAIAIYNATLTAGEVATLTTLMNALPVATGQPAALRGIFVPGMTTGGRRIIRAGWGG